MIMIMILILMIILMKINGNIISNDNIINNV